MSFTMLVLLLNAASSGSDGWVLDPNSHLFLQGTSTLHDYQAVAEQMALSVDAPQEGGHDLAYWLAHAHALTPTLRIDVAHLKSESEGLDENMRAALKAREHPEIIFSVDSCEATRNPAAPDDGVVRIKGRLTVAGASRPVEIVATAHVDGARIRLQGSYALSMLDYGVVPPTFMFGAVRADDRVVIRFDLFIKPRVSHAELPKKGL
jgi:hypothetical protein